MKGKALRKLACMRKQQPRFYWSCSSVVWMVPHHWRPLAHDKPCLNLLICENRCTRWIFWCPKQIGNKKIKIFECVLCVTRPDHGEASKTFLQMSFNNSIKQCLKQPWFKDMIRFWGTKRHIKLPTQQHSERIYYNIQL